jgi:hypothetical protein
MKINLLLLIISMLISTMLSAQATSSIRGQIKDEKGEGIPFINIVLKQNGVFLKGGQTDFDGNYEIGPLEGGLYDLEASYVGYKTTRTERILVRAGAATQYSFKMEVEGVDSEEITIIEYKVPLIKTTPTAGHTLISESFVGGSGMDLTTVVNNTPRPTQTDQGRATYSTGTRDESNTSYPKPNVGETLNTQNGDGKITAQAISSIRGQVKDEKGEGIAFANIVLTQNGVFVKGSQTDFEGNYEIGQLEEGTYDLEASYVGYKTIRTERILVRKEVATEHSFQMDIEGENVDEIVIIDYKVPLVKTTPTAGQMLTTDDFKHHSCCCFSMTSCTSTPRATTLCIHDFFNEPQSSQERPSLY